MFACSNLVGKQTYDLKWVFSTYSTVLWVNIICGPKGWLLFILFRKRLCSICTTLLDQAFARGESFKISSFLDKCMLVLTPRSPHRARGTRRQKWRLPRSAVICRHRRHMRTSAVCGRSVGRRRRRRNRRGRENGKKGGKRERERDCIAPEGRKERLLFVLVSYHRWMFQWQFGNLVKFQLWFLTRFQFKPKISSWNVVVVQNYPVSAFDLKNIQELGIFIWGVCLCRRSKKSPEVAAQLFPPSISRHYVNAVPMYVCLPVCMAVISFLPAATPSLLHTAIAFFRRVWVALF